MHNFARALERAGYKWRPWTAPGGRECVAVELSSAGELFTIGQRLANRAGWNSPSAPIVDSFQGGDKLIAYWPEYEANKVLEPYP